MTTKENRDQDLPEEWVELIKEAIKSNITKEEFKIFRKNFQNLFRAVALQTDQKAKNAFCHSVRVASVLNTLLAPLTSI